MTPWTVAHQASLSIGFSRQEYWSGLPFPPPSDLHNLGIEPRSPTLKEGSLPYKLPGKPFTLYQFSSVQSLSCVRLSVTPWTAACQTSLSIGFSRQEYWSGLPCPPPGDLPNPRIKDLQGLLHCRQILYQLNYQGNPATREANISDLKNY